MRVRCPHCAKGIGESSREGGLRLRLSILLIDPTSGQVSGPCPHCKENVAVADGAVFRKSLIDGEAVLAVPVVRTGVRIVRRPRLTDPLTGR